MSSLSSNPQKQLPSKSVQTISLIYSQKLFLTYFRSLIQHQCTIDVQLKIDITISGKLKFIDNNMCMLIQLDDNQIKKLPIQFQGFKNNIYIRGSAIRAVYMPKNQNQIQLLSDLCKNS